MALLLSLAPARVYEVVETNRQNYGIVWIPEEGPGGGGGGGGSQSLELPPQVMIEGPDEVALSLPVDEPPEVDEPQPEPEERPIETQQLAISAMTRGRRRREPGGDPGGAHGFRQPFARQWRGSGGGNG